MEGLLDPEVFKRHVRMRKKYWVYHEGLRGKPPKVPSKDYKIEEEEEEVTKKLDSFDDEQLYENRLMSPKTKTQLTICAYGSLEDSYIIRKYETIVGGKAVFDTWNHILRIIGKSAFGDEQIIYDIKIVHCTEGALVAVTDENKILTFGLEAYGGKAPELEMEQVLNVASTSRAFAAWTVKGEVYVWGDDEFGGNIDGLDLQNVFAIVGSFNTFTAIDKDGNLTTWSSKFKNTVVAKYVATLTNISTLASIDQSFAALDKDGNVFTWSARHTGALMTEKFENVKKLISSGKQFGVLTNDDKFFYFGNNLQKHSREFDEVDDIYVKQDVFEVKVKNTTYRLK